MHIASAIYGPVQFSRLIEELIDTVEMQRLRFIKQLSFVDLVFPDAVHTRFSHSLGVCYLAGEYAKQLGFAQDSKEYFLVQAAALMHDIGHSPFSHALECLFELTPGIPTHEDMSAAIINGSFTLDIPQAGTIPSILRKYGVDPQDVCALILKEYKKEPVLQSIISSSVDVDRLDYLVRDSYFSGARIGSVDTFRIIAVSKNDKTHITFPAKAAPLLEQMLDARKQMYSEVYIHRTVKIAETMLKHAVMLAKEDLKDFHSLNDNDVLSRLEQSKDPLVSTLAHRVKYRKLFKIAYQLPIQFENKEIYKRLKLKTDNEIQREIQKRCKQLSCPLVLISFPEVKPIKNQHLIDTEDIHIDTFTSTKTNYSYFNVYCDDLDKEEVRRATQEYLKSL